MILKVVNFFLILEGLKHATCPNEAPLKKLAKSEHFLFFFRIVQCISVTADTRVYARTHHMQSVQSQRKYVLEQKKITIDHPFSRQNIFFTCRTYTLKYITEIKKTKGKTYDAGYENKSPTKKNGSQLRPRFLIWEGFLNKKKRRRRQQ